MGHGHYIEKCEHGFVVSQCRCKDRKKRTTIIVDCPPSCIGSGGTYAQTNVTIPASVLEGLKRENERLKAELAEIQWRMDGLEK